MWGWRLVGEMLRPRWPVCLDLPQGGGRAGRQGKQPASGSVLGPQLRGRGGLPSLRVRPVRAALRTAGPCEMTTPGTLSRVSAALRTPGSRFLTAQDPSRVSRVPLNWEGNGYRGVFVRSKILDLERISRTLGLGFCFLM